MRLGYGQFTDAVPEHLQFAAQHGATDVSINLLYGRVPGPYLRTVELVRLRMAVEEWGLRLSAIENVPIQFYDQIILGGPDRDSQIENMLLTIRNIARAGIGIFAYNWMPSGVWRTPSATLRGRAVGTAFDLERARHLPLTHGREYSEEEMWANLESWIRIATPVAEEEGIRLALHPCDPPVPSLGGVPQILRDFESCRRLIDIVPSRSNSVLFCQGTFSQMEDDVYEMIRYFGERDRIGYVHFRNVSGPVPAFHEDFVDAGYVDMARAMRIYRDIGYDGFFIDDHVPSTHGDTPWGHRGRAYAGGYIKGLIEAVMSEPRGRAS